MLGGVQISPDRVEAALMGIDGGIRLCESMDYGRTSTAEHLRAAIIAVTDKCFQGQEIIGIGVAASGMVNASTGQIISMHLTPALGGMEIGNILGSRFGVPVLVDHHPRVQALGDRWFGLGRNIQDFASVYTGEALGFGIVYCGEIVRGKDGAGGESGHTTVQLDGIQCRCGRNGCWETIATLGWLRETAGTLELPAAATMDCRQLVKLSREKVPDAEKLLDTYARNLAVGMANNEQVLASGTYIMHGDVCGGGEPMRLALKRWMHEFSPHRGVPPVILLAASPDQMSLLGGGGMVLSSAFSTIA
ncbi:ROK family protein [Arthrobacter sp. A5]|uniref:ROK family protein n=1 Tax=Arthrobacter sp. A5 TaxID=576926 RepID=UPI003DA9D989